MLGREYAQVKLMRWSKTDNRYVREESVLLGCRRNRSGTHAAREYEAVRAAGIVNTQKSVQAVLSVTQFGARKCPEKLLTAKTLLALLVSYSKVRNAKKAAGSIQTQRAVLESQRLPTKKPSKAAIVGPKTHSLASTSETECVWPIRDQIDDSIIAVPMTATT